MEVMSVMQDVRAKVREHKGLDYLQVYENEKGDKIWVIDENSRSVLEQNKLTGNKEYHHCTILLPDEY